MKAGQIQAYLAETNRWWRDPVEWQRDDPNLRRATAAPFRYRAGALRQLTEGGLYLLRGPRRAGKSTEIKYAILDLLNSGVAPRNIIHAAVDGWRASDLRTLVMHASKTFLIGTTGTRYWFLDEISSISDDWPAVVKNLRDNDIAFGSDTVVLTGSSASRLHEVRKAFAGRRGEATRTDRTLLPMRFTDVVSASGLDLPSLDTLRVRDLDGHAARDQVDAILPYLNDLLVLWESYLRIGGFPQAVASWQRTGDVHQAVVDALWDIVYGDAIDNARFSALQALMLLERLAVNLCSPLNVAELGRDLDIGREATQDRLTNLAESFLAWPCHREQGLAARGNAQSKWYFTDPLLARLAALKGRGREPDLTQLSEQQIGLILLRSLTASAMGDAADYNRVLYYRSPARSEIDFVGPDMVPVAVESKYVDDRWGRKLQTIKASPWYGVLATRSGMEMRDDTLIVPAPLLALLLGG